MVTCIALIVILLAAPTEGAWLHYDVETGDVRGITNSMQAPNPGTTRMMVVGDADSYVWPVVGVCAGQQEWSTVQDGQVVAKSGLTLKHCVPSATLDTEAVLQRAVHALYTLTHSCPNPDMSPDCDRERQDAHAFLAEFVPTMKNAELSR